MNAVIYARYSSDNQREESIEGQLRECMEYCKKNGMVVVKEYIDRAFSAKTDHRPDFQRMIKDSAKGLFDVVVVWKLDRFARNRYDSAHYKAALKKNGVRVVSAKENIADGPEGIILESMLEGMAEYYSAELSEKVIRGHTENALKCKYNGGTPTFGFQIDADKHYQPDPITAPVVLDIFKMYDTGSTMKEIVDHLNGLGVTTVRGKPADMNFISGILHNRRYIGEYRYRDIVVPDGIPGLVPTDLFERVQSKMQKNKKAPARHKAEDDYLLTTKLFCGSCKAMMVGECGTSSSKGQVYHYYRCVNSKRKKTCNAKHKSVRKEPLERAVVSSVMRNIMDDAFVEYFTDQALAVQGQESSELPALRRQLADTEKAIDNLLNAIQAGAFNASVKRRLDEMEETKEKLELSIVKEEIRKPQFTREQIQFYILQFRKVDLNTLEGRRRLIDSFVNSVVVYDDYLLVTFNYKEGAEQITFDQIERSDLSSLGGPEVRTVSEEDTVRTFYFAKRRYKTLMQWFSALRALLGRDPARDKGARGEDLAAAQLARKGWFRVKGLCLRNLYLPAGEGATTEVDLVYLTRKGIYVLESKNYTGRIYGEENWQEWTASVCVGRSWLGRPKTEQHSFYNPLRQNAGHIRALRNLVGEEVPLWSVIVFSGRCRLADVSWDRDDTMVCRAEELPRVLRKLGRRKVLSWRQVRALYDQLEPYTRATWGEKFAHLCQVKEKEKAAARPRRCPWCGGILVVRTARQGRYAGRSFYGCSNYPGCRYKRDL